MCCENPPKPARTRKPITYQRGQNVPQLVLTKPIPCQRINKTHDQNVMIKRIPWQRGHKTFLNRCSRNLSHSSEHTKCMCCRNKSYAIEHTKFISPCVDQPQHIPTSPQNASKHILTNPSMTERPENSSQRSLTKAFPSQRGHKNATKHVLTKQLICRR